MMKLKYLPVLWTGFEGGGRGGGSRFDKHMILRGTCYTHEGKNDLTKETFLSFFDMPFAHILNTFSIANTVRG